METHYITMAMCGCQAKRGEGVKYARHCVWFCFKHSSSLSPRIITRVRGRFYGLWLENKILCVSCRRSNDLQLWMIKWAPAWQYRYVRTAEDPDMSDMWMWMRLYSECGHHSVVICIGTQHLLEHSTEGKGLAHQKVSIPDIIISHN